MTIQECIASIDQCTASLKAAGDRLRLLSLRITMGAEPDILPAWRVKARPLHTVRTQYMRRDYGVAEVNFIRLLMDVPDAVTALATYRAGHQRVLRPKRAAADPDPVSTA